MYTLFYLLCLSVKNNTFINQYISFNLVTNRQHFNCSFCLKKWQHSNSQFKIKHSFTTIGDHHQYPQCNQAAGPVHCCCWSFSRRQQIESLNVATVHLTGHCEVATIIWFLIHTQTTGGIALNHIFWTLRSSDCRMRCRWLRLLEQHRLGLTVRMAWSMTARHLWSKAFDRISTYHTIVELAIDKRFGHEWRSHRPMYWQGIGEHIINRTCVICVCRCCLLWCLTNFKSSRYLRHPNTQQVFNTRASHALSSLRV